MNLKMELAREALCMYLNNKSVAAEELFVQHGCDNYHVKMAHCFTIVMNAVMAFERCELDRATSVLKSTERELAPNTGLVSHIRDKLNVRQQLREEDLVELLERQIILADCQVCSAALCFLQQEIGSFIKGAMGLRRAWKTYDRIYGQISSMYARRHQTAAEGEAVANRAGFFPVSCPVTSSATASSKSSIPPSSLPLLPASSSSPCLSAVAAGSAAGPSTSRPSSGFSPLKRSRSRSKLMLDSSRDMSGETVDRLMGSVSFGYGVFQLVVSLLPDNIVKVAQLLGFQSDRGLALSALNLCRSSVDFRAPLASFTLLAYHTILRPLLSLDGGGATSRGSSGIDGASSGGVAAASLLIDELRPKFILSPLLHYFNGRRLRLQSDLSGSIEAQRHAVTLTNQLEIRLLCLHEIGWCYLLQLNWVETFVAFSQLSEQTRWNKSFFQYLAAVTTGASGDLTQAAALLARVQSSQCSSGASATASQPHGGGAGGPRGSAEVEAFIVRRAATSGLLPHQPPTKETGSPTSDSRQLVYKLMAYELLFLWNALPCCPHTVWRQILADCDAVIAGSSSGVESAPERSPEELDRSQVVCPSPPAAGRCCPPLSQWHAVAHLISGGVYDNLDLLRAETHYRRALQLSGRGNRHGGDGPADLYVAPFASYELADIYCGRPEKRSEGRKLLLSARDDFKNFDFQSRLSIRTQCALRRLERETGKKK